MTLHQYALIAVMAVVVIILRPIPRSSLISFMNSGTSGIRTVRP